MALENELNGKPLKSPEPCQDTGNVLSHLSGGKESGLSLSQTPKSDHRSTIYEYVCAYPSCNIVFTSHHRNRRYCCRAHRQADYRRRITLSS
jgi:hypothetical protein